LRELGNRKIRKKKGKGTYKGTAKNTEDRSNPKAFFAKPD